MINHDNYWWRNLKKLLAGSIAILLILLQFSLVAPDEVKGIVTNVAHWDTFDGQNFGTGRLADIDSPELGTASSSSIYMGEMYVGSIKSNKYHYPDCVWAKKIKPSNEIWFSSSENARSHGYVPCKVCNPP
ncbi:MAG: hypothetical protein MUO26_00165 [Methanotrichaceae archaeon]|nr:hypothetical protein [Methanotrichaceae archaeon]